MINNYGKNLYHSIRNFEVEKDEAKPKGSGLLAPVRSFMQKKTESKDDMPIMIVKRSFDLLNNARSELNGKD